MKGAVIALVVAGFPGRAAAQPAPAYDVRVGIDSAITVAELALSWAVSRIHVDTTRRCAREPFGFDQGVRGNFSASASAVSDALLVVTIVTPLAAQLEGGANDDTGERALLYGETLGASLFANALVKYTVQRPRPYTYNPDPAVQRFRAREGADASVSFYSGHAALAFTSAVAGSTLFAQHSADEDARAVMWGVEITLAALTANLRVRAGKHFWSDVAVGALAGAAIGYLVPAAHASASGDLYQPSAKDWLAIGSGLVAGTLVAHVIPLPRDIKLPLGDTPARVSLAPLATPSGAGLMATGTF